MTILLLLMLRALVETKAAAAECGAPRRGAARPLPEGLPFSQGAEA